MSLACAALIGSALQRRHEEGPAELSVDRVVIVDTVRRGLLPQALVSTHPDALVLAAEQVQLAKLLPDHLPDRDRPLIYISSARYGNTTETRDEIVRLLARHMGGDPRQIGEVSDSMVYRFEASD